MASSESCMCHIKNIISLTGCNSGTTQKFLFRINTMIEPKNITISENTGTIVNLYIPR